MSSCSSSWALDALRQGDTSSCAKVKRFIEVLLVKYGEHMEGEEEILFPAARMALSKEDRERLVTEFSELDRDMFRLSSQLRLKALAQAVVGEVPPLDAT